VTGTADSSKVSTFFNLSFSWKEPRRWTSHFVLSGPTLFFRVPDLQEAATELGHHFLYANLASAQSKQDVLDMIAAQYTFPSHFGKNFDALYDCMTDLVHKSGQQPGFIVVLEHIPANVKFDKEAREQLLDIFRDAADYWADRNIPFRCFYSFL
jgi:RNAse (barnase) inhibitor barstar